MKKAKKIRKFFQKNGKIAKSVLVIAIVLAAAGTTYALFTDRASSEANAISVGDANLKIKVPATFCNDWSDTCQGKQWSQVFPGWHDSYEVFLKNVSASPITLKIVPLVEETDSDQVLYDNAFMEITWDQGAKTTGRYSLQAWKSNTTQALKNLAQNEEAGPYLIKLDIPESAGNDIAGLNITFDIVFGATQMQEYGLTVLADPAGYGEVSGSGNYVFGTSANISAAANPGYEFVNWTGAGIADINAANTSVLVDAEKTVTAHFQVKQLQNYWLNVNIDPPSSGQIINDASLNCDAVMCAGMIAEGTVVQMTAEPNPGYDFSDWSGCDLVTGDGYVCTVTVNGDRNLTAVFKYATR